MITAGACGGGSPVPDGIAPQPIPEQAVEMFMAAVKARSFATMGELWGTASDGPVNRTMDADERSKRLAVIQAYLVHETYEILPPDVTQSTTDRSVHFRVRLTRRGCTPTVPFTLARHRQGWLITNIDLGAAGTPTRQCVPDAGGR